MDAVIVQNITQIDAGVFGTRKITKYGLLCTSDDLGAYPPIPVDMAGQLIKIVTIPVNPQSDQEFTPDPWDLFIYEPDAPTIDILDGKAVGRDPIIPVQVYPVVNGAITPILVAGSYNVQIRTTGNNNPPDDPYCPPFYLPCTFAIFIYVLSLECFVA